ASQEVRWVLDHWDRPAASLLGNLRDYRTLFTSSEFSVVHDRLLLRNPARLETDPDLPVRMIELIGRHGVPLAPDTERRFASAKLAMHPLWSAMKASFWQPHTA